jgi:hypothetical protein
MVDEIAFDEMDRDFMRDDGFCEHGVSWDEPCDECRADTE